MALKREDKLFVNLSSVPLSEEQRSVLSKGLSFCPTPGEPDKGVLREDLDRFHRDLRRKAFSATTQSKSKVINRDSDSDSSESELSGESFETLQPPFKHYKFKPKSNWNPVGPKVVEEFIFLNQEELRKQKVFAPHNKNLNKIILRSLLNQLTKVEL